ncbi:MAG: hypothetical protein KAT68_15820 [Bacteroidales bacterium]|nr:hypothetical protein [Bacteroidales bacterium]
MQIQITTIKFPDLRFHASAGHKLRGYFGNLFKEHSSLLHNHLQDGTNNYKYPLVQYKVVNKIPYIIGINEGGKLLVELFLKIKELNIENEVYPVNAKNISNQIIELIDTTELFEYRFETLWMGLNQQNFNKYLKINIYERKKMLQNILIGNILSFYKGISYTINQQILIKLDFIEHKTNFKNKEMFAFGGNFICNAILPDYIGLGKAVSRGFGCIIKK